MSETQEKPKQEVSRFPRKRFWGCMGLLAFLCFGILGVLVLLPRLFGHLPTTGISPDLMPTAEAILGKDSGEYGLYISLLENVSDSEDGICLNLSSDYFDETNRNTIYNNSSLYLDGAWIFAPYNFYMGYGLPPSDLHWCASGVLAKGLHLVEFHLKDSFWGDPIHIQQWAIQIDE